MTGRLQLGIAGFGRLVRNYYMPALQIDPGVRIAAIADPLAESRRAAKRYISDAEIFDHHSTMLDQSKLDAVLVASPPSTHFEIWSDSTSRGIPAFVEKPLALSSQLPVLNIPEVPPVMIDFNRRFWPEYNRVEQHMRDQHLGMPVELEYGLHLNVLSWSHVTAHRLEAKEGGVLHDLGCHAIDVVTHILGAEPHRVKATRTGGNLQKCRVQMEFQFPKGCSASCDIAYGEQTREWLQLRGPRGTLTLADPNMALHFIVANGSGISISARLHDALTLAYRGILRSKSMARASISSALAAFLHAVKTAQQFSPGFEEGRRNLMWIAAAEQSLATGEPQRR